MECAKRLERVLRHLPALTVSNTTLFSNLVLEVWRMDIRPLHDRIVVKRLEQQEAMQGGLYIPDSAKEKPQEGEVVAVGNGKKNDEGKSLPMDVKVGDRILFGKYSGSDIKLDGEEYMIMREDEVLAVLEGGTKKAKA